MKLGVVTGAVLLILQHAAATEVALDKRLAKDEAVQQSNSQIVVHETADTDTAEKGQRRVKRRSGIFKICPKQGDKTFVLVGNTCYQFWLKEKRFAVAVHSCLDQEAHLMSLETDDKLQSVSKYVKENYPEVSAWRTTGRRVGNKRDWYWCIGCKGNTGKNVPIDGFPLQVDGPQEDITVILKKQADGNYKLAQAQMGTKEASQHQYPFVCEIPPADAKIDCIYPGYEYHGGKFCYKYMRTGTKFTKSQNQVCGNRNGQGYNGILAEPQTVEEMGYLKEYLKTITTTSYMWIGARRWSAGRDFRWCRFENALTHTNWKAGHPNSGSNECVAVTKDGKWSSLSCRTKNSVICQRAAAVNTSGARKRATGERTARSAEQPRE